MSIVALRLAGFTWSETGGITRVVDSEMLKCVKREALPLLVEYAVHVSQSLAARRMHIGTISSVYERESLPLRNTPYMSVIALQLDGFI